MATEFKLPELGENIESGDLVRLMIKPGASIAEGEPVMELETDKAVVEVPSSVTRHGRRDPRKRRRQAARSGRSSSRSRMERALAAKAEKPPAPSTGAPKRPVAEVPAPEASDATRPASPAPAAAPRASPRDLRSGRRQRIQTPGTRERTSTPAIWCA